MKKKILDVSLRHFNAGDCNFITNKLWIGTAENFAENMISEWNSLLYKGEYFEIFAVEANGELAGYVNLYDKCGELQLGADIIPEYRQRGVGYLALTKLMQIAKEKGYKKAFARVLADNHASLMLCKKLDMCITEIDKTKEGYDIYNLEKTLQ